MKFATDNVRRLETGVAMIVTAAAVSLHIIALASAGALWRDEVSGVQVANLPSVADVWNSMQYDSFPLLWLLLVRSVSSVAGPDNDEALRWLGFVIGLGVIATLWFFARMLRHRIPLVSLPLLALSPSMVIWGSSARAYGLAVLVILLAGALIWRFVAEPTGGTFVAAAIASIASVNVIFFNSIILFAFCAGGTAVCVRRKAWRQSVLVISLGALAAISLLPYAGMFRDASEWRMLAGLPEYGLPWFWLNLEEVLRPGGAWTIYVWVVLLAWSPYLVWRFLRAGVAATSEPVRDAVLFSGGSLIAGIVSYLLFLERLSYYPSPWYYLPLLALIAVCLDTLSGAIVQHRAARILRIILVVALTAATLIPASWAVRRPFTNIDKVVEKLHATATSNDIVLIDPWFVGVGFNRYYHGPAAWMTIPPIGAHEFHRYDLIKQAMMLPNQNEPIIPVLNAIEETLTGGGRVFLVGTLRRGPTGVPLTALPPAPQNGVWSEPAHRRRWGAMVTAFIERHSRSLSADSVVSATEISPYENMKLFTASGWRP